MTSQNLHEMLTQLYLELGLSLQDALRAAEADLIHNRAEQFLAKVGLVRMSRRCTLFKSFAEPKVDATKI
jgi:hypothetical protein